MSEFSMKEDLTTPVLLVIFNRPDTARRVFEAIREARPKKLYVAADGPRENVPGDREKCEASREVVRGVDWDCEVKTFFREKNLGCGAGPCSAISWFLEAETEGIVLEDDCLPSPSFFWYCQKLLERYRFDTRIMGIGGNNLESPSTREIEYSYTFSKLTYCWGWATWRRAWKLFDFEMNLYPEIERKGYLKHLYNSIYERDFFQFIFLRMHQGDHVLSRKNVWDYQWMFAAKVNSGMYIVPAKNLVKNIGWGKEATNTKDPNGAGSQLEVENIDFPLNHPEFVMVEYNRERRTFQLAHTSRLSRMKSKLKMIVPRPVLTNSIRLMKLLFLFGRENINA